MRDLTSLAGDAARLLKARGETVAVSESSTGGLISAALLAVPGASAYFLGGGVIYTRPARAHLLGVDFRRHARQIIGDLGARRNRRRRAERQSLRRPGRSYLSGG